MKRIWIVFLIAGIALVAMSVFQFLTRPDRGDPAPLFVLPSLTAEEIELQQFSGKPVLLHFWASWCGPCREELPSLERLSRDLQGKGLGILAISEDGEHAEQAVRSFLQQIHPTFHVLMDADGTVADLYQSWGVPESFLIDREGRIVWRHAGPVAWDGADARNAVEKLLEGGEE